jgi:glycosyltransferase involved in cell wall biosynthesis
MADTFPNTVLEAMACGTPVVAANVGGIPEQVVDGREDDGLNATGFLFEPGDSEELAVVLTRLLEDGGLRAAMAKNAVARSEEVFSIDRCLREYESWLLEISQNHDFLT